jgi:hypothetical protein
MKIEDAILTVSGTIALEAIRMLSKELDSHQESLDRKIVEMEQLQIESLQDMWPDFSVALQTYVGHLHLRKHEIQRILNSTYGRLDIDIDQVLASVPVWAESGVKYHATKIVQRLISEEKSRPRREE